jgi:hypothetical protein
MQVSNMITSPHSILTILVLSMFTGVAACGSDDTPPSGSSPSGGSSSTSAGGPNSSSGSSPSGTLGGTLGGKAFVFKSGFFFKNQDGTLEVNFSDKEGACDDAKESKLTLGQTLVQLSKLGVRTGTTTFGGVTNGVTVGPAAVGDVTSPDDWKYARVIDSCPAGTPVADAVVIDGQRVAIAVAAGRVKDIDKKLTLTALSDTAVEGTMDLKFDDGSTLAGSFKVASCSKSLETPLVCR